MKLTRTEISSLGGKAVFKKYGKQYMSDIGRNGARAFWKKYHLVPVELHKYAIVDRATGVLIGFMG